MSGLSLSAPRGIQWRPRRTRWCYWPGTRRPPCAGCTGSGARGTRPRTGTSRGGRSRRSSPRRSTRGRTGTSRRARGRPGRGRARSTGRPRGRGRPRCSWGSRSPRGRGRGCPACGRARTPGRRRPRTSRRRRPRTSGRPSARLREGGRTVLGVRGGAWPVGPAGGSGTRRSRPAKSASRLTPPPEKKNPNFDGNNTDRCSNTGQ